MTEEMFIWLCIIAATIVGVMAWILENKKQ